MRPPLVQNEHVIQPTPNIRSDSLNPLNPAILAQQDLRGSCASGCGRRGLGDRMGRWRRTGFVMIMLVVAVATAPPAAVGAQEQGAKTWNTEVVGHLAPPQSGGFGDVWAHKDVAYLGNLRQ